MFGDGMRVFTRVSNAKVNGRQCEALTSLLNEKLGWTAEAPWLKVRTSLADEGFCHVVRTQFEALAEIDAMCRMSRITSVQVNSIAALLLSVDGKPVKQHSRIAFASGRGQRG